jgi:hypothetical protein
MWKPKGTGLQLEVQLGSGTSCVWLWVRHRALCKYRTRLWNGRPNASIISDRNKTDPQQEESNPGSKKRQDKQAARVQLNTYRVNTVCVKFT